MFLFLFLFKCARALEKKLMDTTNDNKSGHEGKEDKLMAWRLRCGLVYLAQQKAATTTTAQLATSFQEFVVPDNQRLGPFECTDRRKQKWAYVYTDNDYEPETCKWVHETVVSKNDVVVWFCRLVRNQGENNKKIQMRDAQDLLNLPWQEATFQRWRLRTTMLEMMEDRGYDVLRTEATQVSLGDFYACSTLEEQEVKMTLFAQDKETKHPIVSLFRESLKTQDVRDLLARNNNSANCPTATLIVVAGTIIPQVQTYLEGEKRAGRVQDFWLFESMALTTNPTKHEWQPKRITLMKAKVAKEELGHRYKLSSMMQVPENDILARYYGAHVGDVFQILVEYPHIGEELEYLYVSSVVKDKVLSLNKMPMPMRTSLAVDQETKDDDVLCRMMNDDAKSSLVAPSAGKRGRRKRATTAVPSVVKLEKPEHVKPQQGTSTTAPLQQQPMSAVVQHHAAALEAMERTLFPRVSVSL